MPPQNQNPNQVPETASNVNPPESTPRTPEVSPEVVTTPVSPEVPRNETFRDQPTQPVVTPIPPAQGVQVVEPTSVPMPNLPISEDEEANTGVQDLDKGWVEAVDTVIENDEGKPYEEEEDSEKLQIDYLSKRFGKKIDKE